MTSFFADLDKRTQELIKQHLALVIEANKTTNLTRIDSEEEAMILHIEDSLSGLPEMQDAPPGLYGDLGSGAGYPGIPLAIVTGRKTVLIDARQKKMNILNDIINEMGIKDQVTTFAGRAELLARQQPKAFSVLTARALAKLSVLLELSSPLLHKNGVLICYKSNVEEDEMANALRVQDLVGMKLISDRSFTLADTNRRILTFKKISTPKQPLPRQEGQAQKNPL